MDCAEARTHMLDARRGTIARELASAFRVHLDGCEACRNEDTADAALSAALERLPKLTAPQSLRADVVARRASAPRRVQASPELARSSRATRVMVALAFVAAVAAAVFLVGRRRTPTDAIVAEAVNDHLRVLYGEHLVEIENGGMHQVKPWFAGRLDFAPVVAFSGDDDFPLQGGSVAYFIDRKAAAFVFKRRLHVITLFVFRAAGLPWPASGGERMGRVTARAETSRGFHTLTWQDGDLGYALVSDVDARELTQLGERVAGTR